MLEVVHSIDEYEVCGAVGNQHGRQFRPLLQDAWRRPELGEVPSGRQESMHGAVPLVCMGPCPGIHGIVPVNGHFPALELAQDVHGKGTFVDPDLHHDPSRIASHSGYQSTEKNCVHIVDTIGRIRYKNAVGLVEGCANGVQEGLVLACFPACAADIVREGAAPAVDPTTIAAAEVWCIATGRPATAYSSLSPRSSDCWIMNHASNISESCHLERSIFQDPDFFGILDKS
mmetsp:Transcript_125879/g.391996  ORF Transcript_125879/g.391996 Transcript_125879/m.391996 type:complete len:230 (+) Transcript_125879:227-916(+)